MTGSGMRHVLVVAHNFPPAASVGILRPLRFTRYLAGNGWRVTVLTVTEDAYRSVPLDPAGLARIPSEATVLRAPVWRLERARPSSAAQLDRAETVESGPAPSVRPRRQTRGVKRVLQHLAATLQLPDKEQGWIPAALWRASRALRGADVPDVVLATAPPWSSQVLALALARYFGRPFVSDFRDPWARAPWRDDRPRHVQRALQILEHRVVHGAQRVVFVSEANRSEYEAYYGPDVARRFVLIPNGCETDEFADLHPTPAPGFTLLHAGSLYGGRDPMALIHAIAAARDAGIISDGFRFVQLGGFGRYAEAIQRAVTELNLSAHVVLQARAPRTDCLHAMVSSSALVLLQPGTTVAIPGKLYEYFAAGRPILALTPEGDTARLVRESGVGEVADPDRPDQVLAALQRVLARAQAPQPPVPRLLYDASLQSQHLERVLHDVIDAHGSSLSKPSRTATGSARS